MNCSSLISPNEFSNKISIEIPVEIPVEIPTGIWHLILCQVKDIHKLCCSGTCKLFYDLLFPKIKTMPSFPKIQTEDESGIVVLDGNIYASGRNYNCRFLDNENHKRKEVPLLPEHEGKVHIARLDIAYLAFITIDGDLIILGQNAHLLKYGPCTVHKDKNGIPMYTHIFPGKKFKTIELKGGILLALTTNNIFYTLRLYIGSNHVRSKDSSKAITVFHSNSQWGCVDDKGTIIVYHRKTIGCGSIHDLVNGNDIHINYHLQIPETKVLKVWFFNDRNVWIFTDILKQLWIYDVKTQDKVLLHLGPIRKVKVYDDVGHSIKIFWLTEKGNVYQKDMSLTSIDSYRCAFTFTNLDILSFNLNVIDFDIAGKSLMEPNHLILTTLHTNGKYTKQLINK
jgi:aspartate 1-decarboxylase